MAARNHAWRLGALSLVLVMATSCRDVTSPTSLLVPKLRQNAFACEDPTQPGCDAPPPPPSDPPPPPTQTIVYSAGFYKGSDGYYYWDGRPPVGDLDPARVTDARAEAHAPGMDGNGWVKGYMVYSDGDEAKISMTIDAWQGSTRLIGPAAPATESWVPCATPVGGFFHCQNETHQLVKDLGLIGYNCGVLVSVGGTAYAHKTLPFGLQIGLQVKIFGYTLLESWGEGSAFLRSHTDPGVSCTADATPEPPISLPGGGGYSPPGGVETAPTGGFNWTITSDLWCELIEYHYRYSDGSVSASWYAWQC